MAATKVASSAQGGNARDEGPGVSYASVLNPSRAVETTVLPRASEAKDNNKENIGQEGPARASSSAKERIASQNQNSVARGKSYQKSGRRYNNSYSQGKNERRPYHSHADFSPRAGQNGPNENLLRPKDASFRNVVVEEEKPTAELHNGDVGSDGEFQTVAPKSARRKEKLHHRVDHHSHKADRNSRHHERHAQPPRGHSANGSRERLPHKERAERYSSEHPPANKEPTAEKEDTPLDTDADQQAVKYVEAPLPAINPWMKRRPPLASAQQKQIPQPTAQQSSQTQAKPPVPVVPAPQPPPTPVVNPQVTVPPKVPQGSSVAPTNPLSPKVEKVVQSEREKRVLQPQQQQGKIGEFFSFLKTLNSLSSFFGLCFIHDKIWRFIIARRKIEETERKL